ncbi:PQQ-binding-like beta-propeller repeat protein [Bacteroidota bacterium]
MLRYLLLIFLFCGELHAQTDNWSRFRGFNANGIILGADLPASWDSDDYLWEINLPGSGHSSPVVWGDLVFLTSSIDSMNLGCIMGIDAGSGQILWQDKINIPDLKMHADNSLAMASPAADSLHVYTAWYGKDKTLVYAHTHHGKLKWKKEFEGIEARHGGGNSPMVAEDFLVFTREQEDGSSFMGSWAALDRMNGEVHWEIQCETVASNSFSTPLLLKPRDGNSQLLFASMAHGLTAVDLETGQIRWERKDILPDRVVASPVYAKGKVVACRKGGAIVIQLDPETHISSDTVLYNLSRSISPYVPTPIIVDDLLYLFKDNGLVTAVQLSNGEQYWSERPAGAIYGSPVLVNSKLYCITKQGEVMVLSAGKEYNLFAVNQLGEGSYATPVPAPSGMLFRTFTSLKCLPWKNE